MGSGVTTAQPLAWAEPVVAMAGLNPAVVRTLEVTLNTAGQTIYKSEQDVRISSADGN